MSDPAATTPQQITEHVLRSFDGCPDERLRELMQALIGHLHAFASEVGLTGEEWERAIAALTRSGEITDEHRQEFVLWSDALGLSMLVDALEHVGRRRALARRGRRCAGRRATRDRVDRARAVLRRRSPRARLRRVDRRRG